jgi:flagellar motor switch protein FliN
MVDDMSMMDEGFSSSNAGKHKMGRGKEATNIDLLMDVALKVTVELGRTQMMLRQVLELQHGSVVELDRLAGDAVDIFINERLLARGEVVVVDDKFGVKITELISNGRDAGGK